MGNCGGSFSFRWESSNGRYWYDVSASDERIRRILEECLSRYRPSNFYRF